MRGPIVLLVAGVVLGAVWGGAPGAAVGLILAVGIIAAVVAGASVWAERIGSLLDPEEAFAVAPRPPGFAELCDRVYRRMLD